MAILSWLFQKLRDLRYHFLVLFFSIIVFSFVIFPFNDLSDLITSQISTLTKNTVLVQFNHLNVDIIPSPRINLEEVYIETPMLSPMSMADLTIAPSVSGLISQKPYGQILLKNFLKGDVKVKVSKGSRTEDGVERHEIFLQLEHVNLADLRELFQLPIQLSGIANLESTALADFSLQSQPDVEVKVDVKNLQIPPANVNTPMGPLTLPDLKLGKVEMRGRLSGGRLYIEETSIGNSQDEVFGTLKGNLNLRLLMRNGVYPEIGSYQFDVNLNIKKTFENKAGLFLTFIDKYKSPNTSGSLYKFRVSANNTYEPPNFSALQ